MKFVSKHRALTPLKDIPATRKPYMVRGMPGTLLYLNPVQAANRMDLIPQFGHQVLIPKIAPAE